MLPQKKRRGPAPTGKGQQIVVRMHDDLLNPLDAWIAAQPEPKPGRPAAIRQLLATGLEAAKPSLTSPAAIIGKIETLEAKADTLKPEGPPSPAKAMKTMKRAIVKNDIRKLKNKLVEAKASRKPK